MASFLQRQRLRWLVLVAGVLVIAAPVSSPAAVSYDSLYVFGDSLTDSGNVRTFTTSPVFDPLDAFPTTPPAAYVDAQGKFPGRFTNGLNFADVLANKLFSTSNGLTPWLAGGKNYAVGGALTGTGNVADALFPGLVPTGLQAQLGYYQTGAGSGGADPKALYLVYGGANDMVSMLSAALPLLQTNPTVADALKDQTITTAVGNLGDILNGLAGAGATSFLVPNLPDLGSTPRLVNAPSLGKSFAQQASEEFNTALDAMLATFGSAHPGVKTTELDVFAALNEVLAPGNTTFANKTMGCYPGDPFSPPPAAPTCTDPDQHVFWDDIHPTAAAHAILGEQAFLAVTVPEPETWAVLLAGLALLSQIARRRRSPR